MDEDDDRSGPEPKPYAAWTGLVLGLIALGFSLWVLFRGDVIDNFLDPPQDDPLLTVSLVNGILGIVAGIVAVARREPTRIAVLALVVSIVAVVAKFFLAALVILVAGALVIGLLGGA